MNGFLKGTIDVEPSSQTASAIPESGEACERGQKTTADTSHSTTSGSFSWTRIHSHFALMGGFAFSFNEPSMNLIPRHYKLTQVVITPKGILTIAEYEPALLGGISKGMIQEKSKADGFAKAVVCFQAVWFLIQVVGRMATKFPISVLELNVALHALCCLANYVAWWHKPLDVDRPFEIDLSSESAQKLCAWMIMNSKLGKNRKYRGSRKERRSAEVKAAGGLYVDSDTLCLLYDKENHQKAIKEVHRYVQAGSNTCSVQITSVNQSTRNRRLDIEQEYEEKARQRDWKHTWKLHNDDLLFGFRLCPSKGDNTPTAAWTNLSTNDVKCLKLAQSFCTENNVGVTHDDLVEDYIRLTSYQIFASNGVTDTSGLQALYTNNQKDLLILCTMLGSSIYGALHLLAWNAPFGYQPLTTLWHIAGIIVASPLLVSLLCWLAIKIYRKSANRRPPLKPGFWRGCVRCLTFLTKAVRDLLIFAYVLARLWLVTGSFFNLWLLPDKVYQEPEWSQIIPHFGAG
ncbi:hypothetical protein GQ44DRAFT_771035 [Phaeosphaeriaceae sp. PMI808]|nr:hypothetical protein GQ44DRAFT_771035 [Phaeosphaeriaceae sp. PMI808]